VQGRLLDRPVVVRVESPCGACGRVVRIEVDQDLRWDVTGPGLRPLIMAPSVDWSRFAEPSILHRY
jgi:hypothetical protein